MGRGGTYIFMASLFVIVLPLTSSLPNTKSSTPSDQQRSVTVELSAGVRYMVGDRQLRVLWAGFVMIVVCGFAFQTLIPGILDRVLGRDPTDIGLIFLSFAIAGLIVNLPLATLVRTRWAWPCIIFMGTLMGASFLLLASVSTYLLVLLAAIPLGIGRSGFMLLDNSLLMSNSKPAFFGRVQSLIMMAFGAQALLAPLWGALADSIGIRETVASVGFVTLISMALIAIAWVRMRGSIRPVAELQAAFAPESEKPQPLAASVPAIPVHNGHQKTNPSRPALPPAAAIPQLPLPLPVRSDGNDGSGWRPVLAGVAAIGMALGLAAAQRTISNGNRSKQPQGRDIGPRRRLANWIDPPT